MEGATALSKVTKIKTMKWRLPPAGFSKLVGVLPLVAKLVILFAFFLVRQNLVGFVYLLKLGLG